MPFLPSVLFVEETPRLQILAQKAGAEMKAMDPSVMISAEAFDKWEKELARGKTKAVKGQSTQSEEWPGLPPPAAFWPSGRH